MTGDGTKLRWSVLGLMAVVALCAGLIRIAGVPSLATADPGTVALPRSAAIAAFVVEPPKLSVERASLGAGGTLDRALRDVGVSDVRRRQALRASARFLDVRRLSPHTGLAVARRPNGSVAAICVRAEVDRFLRVGWSHDETAEARPLGTELFELPTRTTLESIRGVIESSVDQALESAPRELGLTAAYADIFQWDVDLLVDPRPGDRVSLIYEVHRLGNPPDCLPQFGDSANREGEVLGLGRVLAASYDGRVAHSTALFVEDLDVAGSYYDLEERPLRKSFLKSPLNYRRISSGFSRARRHPVTRRVVPHHGVDFAAAAGTPVVSTADGRVSKAGWDGPLGRAVRVRHGAEFVTVYGHLQRLARGVRPGANVRQNQVIGYVGSTGRATGPHLHYTMLRYGSPINPMRFENPPAEPLPAELRPRLEEARRRWLPLLTALEAEDRGDPLTRVPVEAGSESREGA